VSVGASVANVLSFGVVILIATIYSVARPSALVNGFVALFPAGNRPRVREILFEMYKSVQRWFLGQLVSMTIIGLLFTIGLSIIGVPFALLLGLLSGLLAFVPFVGPLISVIPPVFLALVDDPIKALWVLAAYGVVQFIEGNIVQPVVMSRAVSLHPAVIVFAILIMGTLFGFVGVFFAIPLVAALHVLVSELWIKQMNHLGTDPNPPRDEPEEEETTSQKIGRLRRVVKALSRRSELALCEETRRDLAPPERLILQDRQVQRLCSLQANQGELVQSPRPASYSRVPRLRVDNELREQRIIVRGHLEASVEVRVHPHAGATGRVVEFHRPSLGEKASPRIFGVDPELHRVPPRRDLTRNGETVPRGYA
jgi:hypothetical protein